MKIKGYNIYKILVSAIILLLLYFAIINIYNLYNIKNPLKEKIEEINGVENVKIEETDKNLTIRADLEADNNLYNVYNETHNITKNIIEDKNIKINFDYLSSERIDKIYYDVHHYLFEGIENKNYSEMKTEIDNYMKKRNINYYLWFDQQRLYLQINHDNKSLYKIFELKEVK